MHKFEVHIDVADCSRISRCCIICHLAKSGDTICRDKSPTTVNQSEPGQCLHLLSLNLRVLVAEIDGVKTAHLSSKLLGLLGCDDTTDDGIL
jgi:hypothetical protein